MTKAEVICVLSTVILIVSSVFLFVYSYRPPLIYRGYPDPSDYNLPIMTLQQLAKYNGIDNEKIFLSIKNIVFDVSDSQFYKPNQSYSQFSGRQIAYMIAKWEELPKYANKYNSRLYDSLTADERKGVDGMYTGTYLRKYKKIARIWYEEWKGQQSSEVIKNYKKYEEL